jgi:toxin ParE1/3/4
MEHPFMGRSRDELVPDLRSILVHPHVIFYCVSDATIDIVRVLHQRRDLMAAMTTERSR